MKAKLLAVFLICTSIVVCLIGLTACTHTKPLTPVEEASLAFKASPHMRTEQAVILFPVVTNGMLRADVERLLGQPNGSDSNHCYYTIFYSQAWNLDFKDDRVISSRGESFLPSKSNAGSAQDQVYAKVRPLFQKYYPRAVATNAGVNGIHFEYEVTEFEFPSNSNGRAKEVTRERGPKQGGILCEI